MGFESLWLAAPKHPEMTTDSQAIALASGATDILEKTHQSKSLSEALAPVTLAFALTARPRDLGPPAVDIRQAAQLAHQHLSDNPENQVAMVLGCERAGLSNVQIAQCQRVCHIPANPNYSSLNVAQALQLAAWEIRYALLDGQIDLPQTPIQKPDEGKVLASTEALEAFLTHWETALMAIEFLDPAHPKKLMTRMRHLFNRNQLSQVEVNMWRGVCTAMHEIASRATPRIKNETKPDQSNGH